jgi:hypothetical protein
MQALQKRVEILMIPMPVISGPTSGTSQWEEFSEWFRQSERWTIGACEVFHYFVVKRRRYNCSAALSYGTWFVIYYGFILCSLTLTGLAGFIKLVKVVQQHTMFPHGAGLWRPDLSIELAPALMLSENCQALRADANAAGVNCFGFSGTNVHARILPLPKDTSLEAVQISDAQVFCWLPKG